MTTITAFQASRMIEDIVEKKEFLWKINRWTKILAVLSSYFRIFGKMLDFLLALVLIPQTLSVLDKILGIASLLFFPLGLFVSIKSRTLFQDHFMARMLTFSVFYGLLMHVVFGLVSLLPLSLTISFFILQEISELELKRIYFSRIDVVLNEENEVDPVLINSLQRYIDDRIRWFTIISMTLVVINLIVYFGTLFPFLYNPITSTLSLLILVILGTWFFFTLPSNGR